MRTKIKYLFFVNVAIPFLSFVFSLFNIQHSAFNIFLSTAKAQSISQQVIGSSGNHSSAVGAQVSSTTGEVVVRTGSNGSAMLTQGFHQPRKIIDTTEANPKVFTIYSGLTPNGDGNNDTWEIEGLEKFGSVEVKIFNRWGQVVWSTQQYNNSTNVFAGKNQQGEEVPTGTYFYILKLDGETKNGWIELSK